MMSRYPPMAGLVVIFIVLTAGCTTYPTRTVTELPAPLERSLTEIPDARLVDVRIEVFDPGTLPASEDAARGLSQEIRAAEARYIPTQLKTTLERTGYWGAVRVVPRGTLGAEVTVSGKILESDGEKLELEVTARDARDAHWFTRRYERVVSEREYRRAAETGAEVFQDLYNEIANDLARYRAKLTAEELTAIRQVAELRFARAFAPARFDAYLSRGPAEGGRSPRESSGFLSALVAWPTSSSGPGNDVIRVERLPSAEDPMMERVRRIRGRDYLLVDTLDQHYDGLYRDLQEPYTAWREARLNEVNTIRAVEREANARMATGIAVAVLGVLAGSAMNNSSRVTGGNAVAAAGVVVGAQRALSAADMRSQASINLEAITESGESFASQVEPFVTEVEGQTVTLVGTAEAKYAQWRDVLRRIYEREYGPSIPSD